MGENLRVKEVWVEGRRYILCYNTKEAEREAMERGSDPGDVAGEALPGAQGPDGEPRFPAVPGGREGDVQDRSQEGEGGGPLRREVGAEDEHRASRRGGSLVVQAASFGRGVLPGGQGSP